MKRIAVLQTATFLFLVAALLAGAWQIQQNRRLGRDGRQAHEALCALKADLGVRIDAGHAFLNDNPNGIPGIPAKTIEASIRNQEATLDALRVLTCPTPIKP